MVNLTEIIISMTLFIMTILQTLSALSCVVLQLQIEAMPVPHYAEEQKSEKFTAIRATSKILCLINNAC